MEEKRNEEVPMIPKHQAETMLMHMSWANRNIMIVAVAFAISFVLAVLIFVNGYTSRTKDWLNTIAQLQGKTAVTEVEDGVHEQQTP